MNTALVGKDRDGLAGSAVMRGHRRIRWVCSQAVGKDILHIGCGDGTVCRILGREGFRCTGVEVGEARLEIASQALACEDELVRQRIRLHTADAAQLPFEDASYDSVVLTDLLEQLSHPAQVLLEARRVLRIGGRMVVAVPCGHSGCGQVTYWPTHLHELVQPHFRTSSFEIFDDSICYTGVKDAEYCFDELPVEVLAEQYLRLAVAVEAYCSERDLELLELAPQLQKLAAQAGRIEELEGALAETERRCRASEVDLEQTRRSTSVLKTRLGEAESSERRLKSETETLSNQLAEWQQRLMTVQAENAELRHDLAIKNAESQQRIAQVEKLQAAKLRESERHFQELLTKKDAESARKATIARLRQVVRTALPVDARVLVISNGDDELIRLEGRHGMHFPQTRGGVYAGYHPKDAAEAIGHLEALIAKGAEYLLIPAGSFWWLEFYQNLRRHLATNSRLVLYDARSCAIYALNPPAHHPGESHATLVQQDAAVDGAFSAEAPSGAAQDEGQSPETRSPDSYGPNAATLAVILDEFTTDCLRPECRLQDLRPGHWKKVLEQDRPDAIFVESAWSGNDGAWLNRLANLKPEADPELPSLLRWAQQQRIPSVFWNKEDPVHFDRFIDAARLFSHVFTTDAGCIPQYQQQLGHDRIYALPFAAQPAIHNPIQTETRDRNVCFAGTYYGSRHAARQSDMEHMLRPAIPFGLEIYDRQHGVKGKGEGYAFPDVYQDCIKGRLDYAEMVKAYKRYRVFLNVNSVKHSSTMFSRRVFELLACGTPVISTYSAGIVELLGDDIVFLSETEADTRRHLEHLLGDEEQWARASVRGIRKVLGAHTYRHRLQDVFARVGLSLPDPAEPPLCVVVRIDSEGDVKRLAATLSAQNCRRFDVVLISDSPLSSHALEALQNALPNQQIVPLAGSVDAVCEACLLASSADYIALMNVGDWYGPHYLADYANAIAYSKADFLGKHTFYEASASGRRQLRQPGHEFRRVACVPPASLVAKKNALSAGLLAQAVTCRVFDSGEHSILSVDRFNYVHIVHVGNSSNRGYAEDAAQCAASVA